MCPGQDCAVPFLQQLVESLHRMAKRVGWRVFRGATPAFVRRASWRFERVSAALFSPLQPARPQAVRAADVDADAVFRGQIPEQAPTSLPFLSELCCERHFHLDLYRYWCDRLREQPRLHRKQWEFVYIAQALWERGMLARHRRGLGFGVGTEPLVSLFAGLGCDIVATDMEVAAAKAAGWVDTSQHARSLASLNERGLCPAEEFAARASFRTVDMNEVPDDLVEFDFCWSACSFEHLGGIEEGLAFVRRSLETLRPGGIAVHTTEYNLSSDDETLTSGPTVIFRERDIRRLCGALEQEGHRVEPLHLSRGAGIADGYIDEPPYLAQPHLRLRIGAYVTTSIGIIVQRGVI
jgi:SAM-dependent methyltransferase